MNEKMIALLNIAERLKEQYVDITFTTGEVETGILSTTRVNDKTFNVAIELTDETGKSMLFDLAKVVAINKS